MTLVKFNRSMPPPLNVEHDKSIRILLVNPFNLIASRLTRKTRSSSDLTERGHPQTVGKRRGLSVIA